MINNYFLNWKKNNFIKKIILIILIVFNGIAIYIYINLFRKKITIAYGLNNDYFFPTFISIISILENSSHFTSYVFYLLIKRNSFKTKHKIQFKYLENIYINSRFIFVEIEENKYFPSLKTFRWPMQTFYKLLISDFIPENKVICLDGDTLVLKDLTEMINLNMHEKIMLGFADDGYKHSKKFGINSFKYICGGVLLINLKKMREENILTKFLDFIRQNKNSLVQVDQTVINTVLNGKVGFLPPKYGIWNFVNEAEAIKHNNYPKNEFGITAYEEKKLLMAFKNPSVIHLIRKPWLNQTSNYNNKYNKKIYNIWWYYAKKNFSFSNSKNKLFSRVL